MPELPEVETTRRGIEPHLKGGSIERVDILFPTLRYPIPKALKEFEGAKIQSIERRAKYLIVETDQGNLLIHLGMTGVLHLLSPDQPLRKHDHWRFMVERDGERIALIYNDVRRFGFIKIFQLGESIPDLEKLAPEPLSEEFSGASLFESLKKRARPIKSAIMDQSLVVGVGNIYANEALFQERIHPLRSANSLTLEECCGLVRAIKGILERAIKQGGTTLQDFSDPDGKPGYFAQELSVYGRSGEECPTCTTKIERIVIGQRATFYCPTCQKEG